jgi:hypothetical protein
VEIEGTDSLEIAGVPPKELRRVSENRPSKAGLQHGQQKKGDKGLAKDFVESLNHTYSPQPRLSGSVEFTRFCPDSPTSTSGYISFMETSTNITNTAIGATQTGLSSADHQLQSNSVGLRTTTSNWIKRDSASSAGGYVTARRYVMMPGIIRADGTDPSKIKRVVPAAAIVATAAAAAGTEALSPACPN